LYVLVCDAFPIWVVLSLKEIAEVEAKRHPRSVKQQSGAIRQCCPTVGGP
jgi:hypothetical protein